MNYQKALKTQGWGRKLTQGSMKLRLRGDFNTPEERQASTPRLLRKHAGPDLWVTPPLSTAARPPPPWVDSASWPFCLCGHGFFSILGFIYF